MAFYPAPIRRELLRILELPEEERIREIGQLYQAGSIPGLAELLLDLEEDSLGQQVRLTMIQQLHRLEREARPEPQPVSPQLVARQLQLVANRAGVELRRPVHSLRHTQSRMLRQVGATVEDVQASLDHSSLATTATYLRKPEGADDPYGPLLAELLVERQGP